MEAETILTYLCTGREYRLHTRDRDPLRRAELQWASGPERTVGMSARYWMLLSQQLRCGTENGSRMPVERSGSANSLFARQRGLFLQVTGYIRIQNREEDRRSSQAPVALSRFY